MKLKKIIIASLFCLSIAGLAACSGQKKAEEQSTEETGTNTSSNAESEAGEGESPETSQGTVKLGNYKGLEISMPGTEVSEEEVNAAIDNNLRSNPKIIEVKDRAIKNGDIANINFVGKLDGVAFDGGTADNYDLEIGSGAFIPGFEEQLIGVKTGESKNVNVTFPAEYHQADLAGKDVVFEVKVNSISVSEPATLVDEWVQEITKDNPLGQIKTVDEYKKFVREQLEENAKMQAESMAQSELITKVREDSEFELNPEAVEKEYQENMAYYEQMTTSFGMSLEDLAGMNNMSLEEFHEELKNEASNMLKGNMVIEAIFEAEKMQLEDADYEVIAEGTGLDATQIKLQYGEKADNAAKYYKVSQYLLKNAKVTIVNPTETETAAEESSSQANN